MTQDSAPARHAPGGAGDQGDRTMPGDRGTLTRGAQPAQDNGRRPAAPGSRRPPRVTRERKPALAALALLLIAGGALGAAYLVLQNGHRVAA